jgi:hypothetical protein
MSLSVIIALFTFHSSLFILYSYCRQKGVNHGFVVTSVPLCHIKTRNAPTGFRFNVNGVYLINNYTVIFIAGQSGATAGGGKNLSLLRYPE